MKMSTNSMILGKEKPYLKNQLMTFAESMADKFNDTIEVCYGKQDSRGALSITLFNSRHCVDHQKHFSSKDELLGFVIGYNSAHSKQAYL